MLLLATFTVMLACLGIGAVVSAPCFPRWRAHSSRGQVMLVGTLVQAALAALVVQVQALLCPNPAPSRCCSLACWVLARRQRQAA